MSVLEAVSITKSFGGLRAVDAVGLEVAPGRITSLIGPNGAGKTTFFNCLTGMLDPDDGAVLLDGRDISGERTDQRARRGIGRTFQRLEVFTGLSVRHNLQVAAEAGRPLDAFLDAFRLRHRPSRDVLETVDAVLERLGIAWAADAMAGDLPTGVLRLVELGRALCTRPSVLLLDELASGLDERETEDLGDVLTGLAEEGLAILLIEHDIELVLAISTEVHVLDFGRIIARGTPEQVAADPNTRAAYIGSDASGGRAGGSRGRSRSTARSGEGPPEGSAPASGRRPARRSARGSKGSTRGPARRRKGGRRGAAPRG